MMPWLVTASMCVLLVAFLVVCLSKGDQLQQHWPEDKRILLRTLFYIYAIIIFPLTNLIRHIQLRLNETMPGDKPAKKRYLLTVIVSMTLIETVGILGLLMFFFGDGYNTLYIFSSLSALGLFLYRPKAEEYARISVALETQQNTP